MPRALTSSVFWPCSQRQQSLSGPAVTRRRASAQGALLAFSPGTQHEDGASIRYQRENDAHRRSSLDDVGVSRSGRFEGRCQVHGPKNPGANPRRPPRGLDGVAAHLGQRTGSVRPVERTGPSGDQVATWACLLNLYDCASDAVAKQRIKMLLDLARSKKQASLYGTGPAAVWHCAKRPAAAGSINGRTSCRAKVRPDW